MGRVRRQGTIWLGVGVGLGFVLLAGPARGQWQRPAPFGAGQSLEAALASHPVQEVTPDAPEPRTFGTASEVAHTVHAWEFDAFGFNTFWDTVSALGPGGSHLRRTGGSTMYAGLRLPAGAQVTRFQLDGCDFDSGTVTFALAQAGSPPTTGPGFVILTPAGATSGTPGCGFFSVTLDTPLTIDNVHNTYMVLVTTTFGPSGTMFAAVRVFYRLQASPAPAAATFGDVPTSHPFFQFVEALVASGITAGCSAAPASPLYCPDEPLTRGQMAVFLGKALGLHFAP